MKRDNNDGTSDGSINITKGLKLRFAREQIGLTRGELAIATSYSVDYIAKVEDGKTKPSLKFLSSSQLVFLIHGSSQNSPNLSTTKTILPNGIESTIGNVPDKKPTTVQEAGRKGGQYVRDKYGSSFYVDIGKKGGRVIADTRGADYYAQIGKKGGERVRQLHGSAFFAEIGRKGGNEVKRRHGPKPRQ